MAAGIWHLARRTMDVFLARYFWIVALPGFVIIWLGSFVVLFAIERFKKRGPAGAATADRILQRTVRVIVAFALSVVGLSSLQTFAARRHLSSITASLPDVILLQSGDALQTTLTDRVAIAELCRNLDDAESVSAHHSHPTTRVSLTFPNAGYTYSVARDSEQADEYWLTWTGYPGSGPQKDLVIVRQMRSDALSRWLSHYVPVASQPAHN